MSSPARIRAVAAQHDVGLTIIDAGVCWQIDCWAPVGKVWRATGTHFLSLEGDGYYTRPDWRLTMLDLRSALDLGFNNCTEGDCDVCCPEHPPGDGDHS